MTYAVKEIFPTIQGEGFHAGRAAVFVRMAGCNLWSGREVDRERDAARNGAQCPRWCDTDFVGGSKLSAKDVVDRVGAVWRGQPLIVFTGGEPLLQVDDRLLDAAAARFPIATIAFETNGTVAPRFSGRAWLTLSPKTVRARCALVVASEIKVLVPSYDPREWESFPVTHRFVQPVDGIDGSNRVAVDYVLAHPSWRLSVQAHKAAGFP